MPVPLKPTRGGFLRPFGCAQFIRDYLLGLGPAGSPRIDPAQGAVQVDIFRVYKTAQIKALAMDRAIRDEERQARHEKRRIDPEKIEALATRHEKLIPFRSTGCRYNSFSKYFSMLHRMGWVRATGRTEPSLIQEHYAAAPSRVYYRITAAGRRAGDAAWTNPRQALYGCPTQAPSHPSRAHSVSPTQPASRPDCAA